MDWAISAAPVVHWIGLKCLCFGDMYCTRSFSHVQRWHLQAPDPILVLWSQEISALALQNKVRLHVNLCLGGFVLPFGFDSLTPADALPDSITSCEVGMRQPMVVNWETKRLQNNGLSVTRKKEKVQLDSRGFSEGRSGSSVGPPTTRTLGQSK